VTYIWWLFCGKWSATYGILWVFATLYQEIGLLYRYKDTHENLSIHRFFIYIYRLYVNKETDIWTSIFKSFIYVCRIYKKNVYYILWSLFGYQARGLLDTYMKMYILMYIHRSLYVFTKETYILINLFGYQGISLLDTCMKIYVHILFFDIHMKKPM